MTVLRCTHSFTRCPSTVQPDAFHVQFQLTLLAMTVTCHDSLRTHSFTRCHHSSTRTFAMTVRSCITVHGCHDSPRVALTVSRVAITVSIPRFHDSFTHCSHVSITVLTFPMTFTCFHKFPINKKSLSYNERLLLNT